MATIKKTLDLRPDSPIPKRPEGHDLLCFGSIEWPMELGGPMTRNISDAFEVQHWLYQRFLDQQTGEWHEPAGPVQINIELQPPIRDGDMVRTSFLLTPVGAAKQSVRVAVKPGVRWIGPGDQVIGRVTLDPPELYFSPDAKRLPAIRLRAA